MEAQVKRSPLRKVSKKRPKSGRTVGKLGRVRVFGKNMTELREAVYTRAQGLCELKLKGCEVYAGWISGQLCHVKSKGSGGSDTESNTLWGCLSCHAKSHNAGGKPCPKKVV